MKTFNCGLLLCFSAVLFGTKAGAQNIINDTVVVSTGAQVTLLFPSQTDKADLSNPDGSYEVGGTKKFLLIKALRKDASPQWLTVNEGSNRHTFVLLYNENVPLLRRDWSNKKKLATYVKDKKDKADAGLAEANGLLDKGEYDLALAKYSRLVHDVEEAERAPIENKIAECEKQSQGARQKIYKDAMTRANALMASKKYKEAVNAGNEALAVSTGDMDVLKLLQSAKSLAFKEGIAKATGALNDEKYIRAKSLFEEARDINPTDFQSYKVVYENTVKKANSQWFQLQKDLGDDAFEVHDWNGAKQSYDSALLMKANDNYCIRQLDKTKEAMEKDRQEERKEAEYYAILSTAKQLAESKDFDGAIVKYNAALVLFPERRFAKEKKDALAKLKSNASAKR